jgi:hypothetical protein
MNLTRTTDDLLGKRVSLHLAGLFVKIQIDLIGNMPNKLLKMPTRFY